MSFSVAYLRYQIRLVIIVISTLLLHQAAFGQTVILRVDGNIASAGGDGTGWGDDAFKFLQDALAEASENATQQTPYELWVAATVQSNPYVPDRDAANPFGTGDRDATFLLDFNNVTLLGGFFGDETDPDDRDPALNETVLSGDIRNPFENCAPGSGNCFTETPGIPGCDDLCGGQDCPGCCWLVCETQDPSCCDVEWDEFCRDIAVIICLPPPGDLANAYHVVTANGVDDSVRLDGFTVTDGLADGGVGDDVGAGMFIADASLAVVRVSFTENSAPGHGGGAMHIEGTSHPRVVNCSMTANDGSFGGAIHIDPAPASATLVNCLISGNTANSGGGGIDARSDFPATLDLINCTVTDNTAQNDGGGIWVFDTMEVTITNSILWGNVPNQISGVATVTYSDVEGGWAGEGNLDPPLDPFFVDAGNGDYRLDALSPCIDKGDPDVTVIPVDEFDVDQDGDTDERTPDLDLNDRLIDTEGSCSVGIVDMGAYEAPPCCPWDMDNTGGVGASDLLTLLADWGMDLGGPPDFDCDGNVGASDLLALLANWGACPCGIPTTPPTIEQEMAAHCLTMDDWDKFVDKMQNGTEAEKENYLCWMEHYLDECSRCFCTGEADCPDDDPYNG